MKAYVPFGFATLNLGTRRGQSHGPAALPLMSHQYPLGWVGPKACVDTLGKLCACQEPNHASSALILG